MLRRALLFAAIGCTAAVCSAATDPFVGKWKLNPDKSKIADQMTIQAAGKNTYTLAFSGSGETETVPADGTDHPGIYGSTVSVTVEKPGTWKIVRKQKGATVLTAIWKLSRDGKTLTDAFTSNRPDGSTSTLILVYRRAGGKSGIPGTWETTDVKIEGSYELGIQPFGGDGLSFITPDVPSGKSLKFDGKEYRVPAGAGVEGMSAGRRQGPLGLEITTRVEGKVLDTRQLTVSADGKSLTIVIHRAGQRLPTSLTFDRGSA